MTNHPRLLGASGLIFSLFVGLISPAILPSSIFAQAENQTVKQESKKKRQIEKIR